MVIDTSAISAIFFAEPERDQFLELIAGSDARMMSTASVLESGIVLEGRQGESVGRDFDLFLARMQIRIVDVDADQVEVARRAWRKFGKGRHPAALNFGDCFVYALAKINGEPILAKGNFTLTDIPMCVSNL